jgi:hypothetical protein
MISATHIVRNPPWAEPRFVKQAYTWKDHPRPKAARCRAFREGPAFPVQRTEGLYIFRRLNSPYGNHFLPE